MIPPGVRVVLDARALQDPDRAPTTARYLGALLGAFDAEPLAGESFAFMLQSDLGDPTSAFRRLDVAGRRRLPPTRLLRSGALTVDPFLLLGASVGTAWRADRRGAAGAVYHAVAGAAPLPLGLPTVVTLLDLAPWELPETFQRTPAARFGQRLRARLVSEARAVIVGSHATARAARRLLHVKPDRLRVVPLAADPAMAPPQADDAGRRGDDPSARDAADRLGLPERYLVYFGRFDARHDVGTLLRALASLEGASRPRGLPTGTAWPPRLLIVGATPDDRAAMARVAGRVAAGEALAYAPAMAPDRLAPLIRGARAVVLPSRSDASGFAALDALAAGVPVVATEVGALPEIVGQAGILVEPRDPARLAEAIRTAWADDRVHATLVAAAIGRPELQRTWADVARETRQVYAEVGVSA